MPTKDTNDELLEEKLRHDYQQEKIDEYRKEQELKLKLKDNLYE